MVENGPPRQPSEPRDRRRRALRLIREGRLREALHEAAQLRLAGELDAELAHELGATLAERQRDHARALPWFEAAEKLGHHDGTICRAHCLLNLGRAQEAYDLYAGIARAAEAHPAALLDSALGMAKATFDMGDAKGALTLARQALEFYKDTARSQDLEHARQVIAWLESETTE